MDSTGTSPSTAELLHDLLASNHELSDFLNELAQLSAAQVAREQDTLCAILLRREKRNFVVAYSSEKARILDEAEAGFNEGPCLEAEQTQTLIRVPDVRHEKRWPDYMDVVRDSGLRSVLAVPLHLGESTRAAMDFYTSEPGAFDEDDIAHAQQYASLASRTLSIAVRIANLSEVAEDRRKAMESRTVIDVAVGIIMAQNRCSQDEAFEILRNASSNRNIKLRDLAEGLVSSLGQAAPTTTFED